MFSNYLKIALRNLLRHKVFSLINIFGLALGMTCSILIMLWVKDEISFNRFHKNIDTLYRVMEIQHYPGGDDLTVAATPGQLAPALKAEVPEIENSVRMTWESTQLFAYKNKVFKEKGTYSSPELFEMFSFPLVQGEAKTALAQPKSVVISRKMAEKYFGSEPALGKMLKVDNQESYKVTGVMEDFPKNSSLQFEYVLPIADYEAKNEWTKQWGNNGLKTFVMLRPGADMTSVNAKIKDFIKGKNPDSKTDLFLQSVSDMYLHSDFRKGKNGGGKIEYVRLFSVVAIFILIIACINFMNLSTARSAKRAKEVGVRKVIGASRKALIGQFLGESLLLAVLAIFLSVNLTQIVLPTFNELTGKEISINLSDPAFLGSLVVITLLTGIISGSYPAFFLSSFKPVSVLKGTIKFSDRVALFRKGLVVFQFILSAVLIISTLVVYRQVQYIHTKNIGLDRENVVYVPVEGDLAKSHEAFKRDLLHMPGIKSVSSSNINPIAVYYNGGGVEWPGKSPDTDILFTYLQTDYDFLKTMDIKLKEGRDFSRSFGADSAKVLINEEAVRLMQMKEPVGQWIKAGGQQMHIIGVVKDFHATSMYSPTQPLIMFLNPQNAAYVFARTEPGQTTTVIENLGKLVKKYNPDYPFEYKFLDEDFDRMYKSESVIGKLTNYFAGLAILISCLGLFGLALFTAEQRTKEIGIRKVLGASTPGIVAMLSKDFLKLVLIANLIAWPLSWYYMQQWLENYAERTSLDWWIFAVAGLATMVIALLTVSFHAVRTAISNPVRSLRSE